MKTLVVIDDEPVIREMLVRRLEGQGWHVLQADNGTEGLALVAAHRPAAVLCDLLMPGTTGFNVCRAIRARRDELGDVTIIVTTGSSFPADRQSALEAGANYFLVKPVSPAQVAEILATIPCPPAHKSTAEPAAPADNTTVRFWGVRGSIATPGAETVRYGGNTTCVEVRVGNEIIILDAGTGIRPLGERLRREFAERPLKVAILLSHTHWDHIQGLPFFGPSHDRGNSITVLGYEGAKQSLLKTLAAQMDSAVFPIGMDQLAANVVVRELHELDFRAGRVPVQATFMNHPGVTLGYRLGTPGGGVVFMPDTEIMPYPRARPARAEPTPDADTERFNAYKNQLLAEFAHGAELLICDAQYTAEEYERRVGWGHSCIDDTVRLALQAKAKCLVLFHHDPTHDDGMIDSMVAHARRLAAAEGAALQIEAAAEGMEITLSRKPRCCPTGCPAA
ncbi:MAG TPA: response regulator [Opitutaceae bacterium]|nr:response regulator [Opitutaceae bacterium]